MISESHAMYEYVMNFYGGPDDGLDDSPVSSKDGKTQKGGRKFGASSSITTNGKGVSDKTFQNRGSGFTYLVTEY